MVDQRCKNCVVAVRHVSVISFMKRTSVAVTVVEGNLGRVSSISRNMFVICTIRAGAYAFEELFAQVGAKVV